MRVNSRRRRFSRFRATAECLNRGIIKPIRTPFQASPEHTRGEAAARTSICTVRMRFPSRAMRCSSAPRVIRAFRGKLRDTFAVLCSRVLVWDTNRQLLSPLFSTSSKGRTSPLCFHSRTKTVRFEPACITRAISWLSHKLLQIRSRQNSGTDW